jgi:DNA-binding transcriptional regulator GbsR (MarR family)
MKGDDHTEELARVREEFVGQWGVMGSAWGINRTMAQIHALLLMSPGPLSTNEIMDALGISRGNANTNVRDLVGWGLLRSHFKRGDRKEYFEAEKDVWKIFTIIAQERKRREIDPAMGVIDSCLERVRGVDGVEAKELAGLLGELKEFMELGSRLMARVAKSEQPTLMKVAAKLLAGRADKEGNER